jgi:hypothetical protein
MAGNVWEWVADYYSGTYYTNSPAVDPMGPDSGTVHILRGGSWYDSADLVRTTVRLQAPNPEDNNFGFRCAAAPGVVNPSSAVLSNARPARDQDGKDQTSIFKGADTIYIVADLSNAAKGTVVNAKLYGVNLVGVDPNTLLDSKDIVISDDNFSGTIHFDFPVGQGGDWWLGTYTTKIYVDGVLSASVDWGVQ